MDDLVHPAQSCEVPARGESLDELPLHHVGRLIRGDNAVLGAGEGNPYASTTALLQEWKQTGVLTRDPRPSVYVYRQVLPGPGERQRWGVVGSVEAVGPEEGGLAPHEQTQGERPDLMNRLRTTETQLSLAWGLVRDASGGLSSWMREMAELDRPLLHVMDGRGVLNTVWKVEDPEDLGDVGRLLAPEQAVLADGHHRHACALQLRQERRAGRSRGRGRAMGTDRIATWLTPVGELPERCAAHPLALTDASPEAAATLTAALDQWFERTPKPSREALTEALAVDHPATTRLGMVVEGSCTLLTLRPERASALAHLLEGHPRPQGAIEGCRARVLLSTVVAEGAPDERLDGGGRLTAIKPTGEAVAGGGQDISGLLFMAPGLTAREVWSVGSAGATLPSKSTWFEPKPPKGLLMASLKGL